jgi:cytochrome c oxidase cbb3-type subunit 4
MKFIHYLEKITGVSIYPLSSLLIFFLFFTMMTIWVFKADKSYLKRMKYMPLPETETE